MPDVKDLLREAVGTYEPVGDERAVERRLERRRRNQRISSAVVALGVFAAAGWLGWTVIRPGESTPGATPTLAPATVVVPEVVGMAAGEARDSLRAVGLSVSVTTEPSDEVEAGVVVGQDPPAGVSIEPESLVTIVVSEGSAAGGSIPLEGLPEAGVAVSFEGGVRLVDLEGRVVEELTGFELVGNPGAPGVWLQRDGSYYALSDVLGALVPVTEEQARDRAFDEGPEPTLPPPPNAATEAGEPVGHWRYAVETRPAAVLAQWSGACEDPTAYWIEGGDTTIVTGEDDPSAAPASSALGWSRSGEAIVLVSQGACGGTASDPGIYVFSAPDDGRLIHATPAEGVVADAWGTGL
jgi:hypothetical protein